MLNWKEHFGNYLALDDLIVNPNSGIAGLPVLFDIEVLHEFRQRNPLGISICHLETTYKKVPPDHKKDYQVLFRADNDFLYTPLEMKSWSYFFDCKENLLKSYDYCRGDFTEPEFSWSKDNRVQKGDGPFNPAGKPYKNASRIFPIITSEVDRLYKEAKEIKKADIYHGFLVALRKVNLPAPEPRSSR